nr:hypothetical protein [Clostridium sp. Marseille-P7770]
MNNKDLIEELITTIEDEFNKSNSIRYYCNDGTEIATDVGYVAEWFEEYKEVLRRRYCN